VRCQGSGPRSRRLGADERLSWTNRLAGTRGCKPVTCTQSAYGLSTPRASGARSPTTRRSNFAFTQPAVPPDSRSVHPRPVTRVNTRTVVSPDAQPTRRRLRARSRRALRPKGVHTSCSRRCPSASVARSRSTRRKIAGAPSGRPSPASARRTVADDGLCWRTLAYRTRAKLHVTMAVCGQIDAARKRWRDRVTRYPCSAASRERRRRAAPAQASGVSYASTAVQAVGCAVKVRPGRVYGIQRQLHAIGSAGSKGIPMSVHASSVTIN